MFKCEYLGIQFWSYTNYNMDKNYPKLISEFGLPTKGKIDAAFVWKNVTGETYFIQGNKYWKYEKVGYNNSTKINLIVLVKILLKNYKPFVNLHPK